MHKILTFWKKTYRRRPGRGSNDTRRPVVQDVLPAEEDCIICMVSMVNIGSLSCCKNRICKECRERCGGCPFCRSRHETLAKCAPSRRIIEEDCVICSDSKDDIGLLSCCKSRICKECNERCESCPFCRSTQKTWTKCAPSRRINDDDVPPNLCTVCQNRNGTMQLWCCRNLICKICNDCILICPFCDRSLITNNVSQETQHPQRFNNHCVVCGGNGDDLIKVSCCKNTVCQDCDYRQESCQICRRTCRFWIGNTMPKGNMTVLLKQDIQLYGVDRKGCYHITYAIHDSYRNMVFYDAYIPYTIAGLHALLLLILAFYRNLTFTSDSTKTLGWVRWNIIPHKTSLLAGNRFGYPDSRYLEDLTNVLSYLKISHDDLREEDRSLLYIWRKELVTVGFLKISS